MLPKLLTIAEVAAVLRVSRLRAYELVRRGFIPAIRIGRQLRVAEDALAAFIEDGGKGLGLAENRSSQDTRRAARPVVQRANDSGSAR